ncbi:hypothetical protein HD806DRAFT_290878 [Xylariaceae sp. AK1471]|nr:hypothetical protein HD806DRAFT_290878 [Xylariaceae sp. AK1471]
MARNLESALNIASSTPDSSPADVLGDTKIRRPLVKIASDQKQLLDRHESWASFLGRRPNGFVNVPPQVLEQLKTSYSRQRQRQVAESQKLAESTIRTGDDTNVPEPSGSQSPSPPCVAREAEDSDDGDGDNNEDGWEKISWPPTPNPPVRSHRVESEEPSQPFITQLPEKSPLQPTVLTSPEHHKLPEFPQSSQEPEDELELEVPAALAYNPMPINKSALPMLATPPSAQIVPCSIEQSMQSVSTSTSARSDPQSKSKSRKPIYKPVPEFYRPPKQGAVSSHLDTNIVSVKDVTAPNQIIDIKSSASIGNTSSSIIPSTSDDHSIESQKHAPAWDVRPAQISTCDTNLSSENHHSPLASRPRSPIYIPPSPSRVVYSPQPPVTITHPATPPAIVSKSWEAPFDHYTVTYPNYGGTIQDFITACIYIQLQYRRIRTSLYDDFIRAWVEGYLPYVRACDEAQPPKKALRAIDWYNEIDDDPMFTSRVVTRKNLQSILNFYPNELQIARRALGIPFKQAPSEHPVSNGHAEPYAQETGVSLHLPTHKLQLKGKDLVEKLVEAEARVPKLPPIAKPAIPPFPADQHIQAHKSFGGIESRRAESKGLTRSLSETMSHKRKSTSEFHSEGTKRRSLGLTLSAHNEMWSDSGSTVSNHSERSRGTARSSVAPESTAAKGQNMRNANDAEERRRRRLAKHFKKQMAERESIASSAPISNTPTSGQRPLK